MMSLMVSLAGFTAPAISDDTEIYLEPKSNTAGEPLIMLSLDYRSNLGSTVCQGYAEISDVPDQTSTCGSIFYEASGGDSTSDFLPDDPASVKFFEIFRAVLKVVMEPLDGVKIGLMLNHNHNANCEGPQTAPTGNSNGCSNGGYIYLGLKSMTTDTTSSDYGNKAAFHDKLGELPLPQGNVSHSYQGAELFFEFYRYLTGQNIYNGHNGYTDFDSSDDAKNLDHNTQNPEIAWDTSIEQNSNTQYISPLTEDCTGIYTINFMFAVANQENDSNTAIQQDLDYNGGDNNGGLGISVTNSTAFRDVISGLNSQDIADGTHPNVPDLEGEQNVTSYFFVDSSQATQANQKGYALAGGTVAAYAMDTGSGDGIEQIKKDLAAAFDDILSISTTFVSATAPVNTFNRSESLENVFFGMFEPETAKQWNGNVKRLRLYVNAEGVLMVLDANQDVNSNPVDAISTTDGRIKSDALTFWTSATGVDVATELGTDSDRPENGWDTVKAESAGTDGKSVNRGGAGQRIPGFIAPGTGYTTPNDAPTLTNGSGREILTEPASFTNGTAAALMDFDADLTTAEALWDELCQSIQGTCTSWAAAATTDTDLDTIFDQAEAVLLIGFQRGVDVYDHDGDGSTSDSRPWLFADILHAQPNPLNFGTRGGYSATNPNINILVAGNDGYVRSIRNNTTAGDADGHENWAFLPRELMSVIGDLAENNLGDHPYGADGGISIYINDYNNDGTLSDNSGVIDVSTTDFAIAYFGLRRGGNVYYALDVSDPDTPKILWRITDSGDFTEMGDTWSKPALGNLDWGSGVKPVIIVAGGYDTNKDDRPDPNDAAPADAGTNDTKGNALFIIDALTGDLVWKAIKGTGSATSTVYQNPNLNDSIPSEVTAFDSNGDGVLDRIYVGDTGGVVWRVDIEGNDPTDNTTPWVMTRLMSVGRHSANSDPDRRFFHRPDVVPTTDSVGNFDAVMIGTGNRPNPKQDDFISASERFFMYKDRNVVSGYPSSSTIVTSDVFVNITTTSLAGIEDCISDASSCTGTGGPVDDQTIAASSLSNLQQNGWFIDLVIGQDRTPAAYGEKILSTSLTYKGVIFFTSYLPSVGAAISCGPVEGESYTYVVHLEDGSAYFPTFNENGDRAKKTGDGIGSDPIVICKGGKCFPGPGNLAPDEEFREGFNQDMNKTFWYEETQ